MAVGFEDSFFDSIDPEAPIVLPAEVRRAIDACKEISTLGPVAVNILRVVDDFGNDAAEIERVLGSDPGLSSRVLKIVNSAQYALKNKITRLRDAVTLLGRVQVRSIALSATVLGSTSRKTPEAEILWEHAISVGTLARLLALHQRDTDASHAFLAGVLHDLGKTLLYQAMPDLYAPVIKRALEAEWEFCSFERKAFGCDHADVGAAVAREWGFSPALTHPIQFHHNNSALYADSLTPEHRRMIATVKVADDIFRAHRLPDGHMSPVPVEVRGEALDFLALDPKKIPDIWNDFVVLYVEAKAMLSDGPGKTRQERFSPTPAARRKAAVEAAPATKAAVVAAPAPPVVVAEPPPPPVVVAEPPPAVVAEPPPPVVAEPPTVSAAAEPPVVAELPVVNAAPGIAPSGPAPRDSAVTASPVPVNEGVDVAAPIPAVAEAVVGTAGAPPIPAVDDDDVADAAAVLALVAAGQRSARAAAAPHDDELQEIVIDDILAESDAETLPTPLPAEEAPAIVVAPATADDALAPSTRAPDDVEIDVVVVAEAPPIETTQHEPANEPVAVADAIAQSAAGPAALPTPASVELPSPLGQRFLAYVVESHPFAWPAARSAWARCGKETGDPSALATLACEVGAHLVEALGLSAADLREQRVGETQPFVDAGQRHRAEVIRLARDVDGFFAREAIAASITADEKRALLRGVVLTRAVDNKMKQLFLSSEMRYGDKVIQGKGFRSLGQEAIYAAALRLRTGKSFATNDGWRGDVVGPLIRDLGVSLAFATSGWDAGDDDGLAMCLNAQVGKSGAPHDGKDLHLAMPERGVFMVAAPLSIASCTMTGAALGFQRRGEDRVAFSFIGEGGSSLGEWHEAINFAAVQKLPIVFCVENNQTALSTSVAQQSSARTFADKALGYGIPGITIDGTDALAVAAAFSWAAQRARQQLGPTLIETVAMRMCGHAHHDDMLYLGADPVLGFDLPPTPEKGYVDKTKYAAWAARDPLHRLASSLRAEGVIDEGTLLELQTAAVERVEGVVGALRDRPWAEAAKAGEGVFADHDVVARHPVAGVIPPLPGSDGTPRFELRIVEEAPPFDPRGSTFLAGCGQGLLEVLQEIPEAFLIGEDLAPPYGNAFLLLKSLLEKHGDRILNTPIAEGAIIGACVGAALVGQRPIGEIQFNDFVASGFNQLVNNAAKLHYRAGTKVPMTLRMPWGGLRRAGPYHSQDTTPWFFRSFGLKIVVPSTPHDARALMMSAVVDDDPVLFYEHIALYRLPRIKQHLPSERPRIALGTAAFRRLGDDLTILSYGAYVHKALDAARKLEGEGVSCDVVDLRSLVPLDWARIEASVRHTGKVLLIGEDSRTGSVIESIASKIAESLYAHLDGPVRVLGALDTPVPYGPSLEDAFLLSDELLINTARALARC